MKFSEFLWRISRYLSPRNCLWLGMKSLHRESEQITFRRNGTLWTGFIWDEYITHSLFCSGGYGIQDIRTLLAWMKSRRRFTDCRNVIIDVGANIGTSAIPFAKETNCRILAIEPAPENFAVLRQNVIQNGFEHRIICFQAAVSESERSVRMVMPETNSGGAEIINGGSKPSFAGVCNVRSVVEVPADTLDNILMTHRISPDRVSFVWSDTQGCERQVIESGSSLWLAGVPLYAEIDSRVIRTHGGIEPLVSSVLKFFDRFILSGDMIKRGASAECRPVSQLMDLYNPPSRNEIADVLLLPKGYEFSAAVKPAPSLSQNRT